jgi:hypothetical protein
LAQDIEFSRSGRTLRIHCWVTVTRNDSEQRSVLSRAGCTLVPVSGRALQNPPWYVCLWPRRMESE